MRGIPLDIPSFGVSKVNNIDKKQTNVYFYSHALVDSSERYAVCVRLI